MDHLRQPPGPRTAPSRRPRTWPTALVAPVLVLSTVVGCSSGQDAATSGQVSSSCGAQARVGEMAVLDVEFLFDPPVAGDEVFGVGQTAPLAVTLTNTGRVADRLVRVSSPIAKSGIAVADDLVVPAGGP